MTHSRNSHEKMNTHIELNLIELMDIKIEDVEIKMEPDDMYSQEEVDEMELPHFNINYLKEEIEPVSGYVQEEEPDVSPHQAQPTKCYRCGISAAIVQRKQILTRSITRKLDKHSVCHLDLQ